ncbi:hypothetical protein [Actinokineospora sp.]|uniref:hypothetical protein n=1 Tax=Actinokineospora sp. TaxID=1872133 RepID=UPI003D6C694D
MTGHTCPSASAAPGATLLGVFGPNGRAIFTPHGPKLTPELRDTLAASTEGPLEARFRFAAPCAQSACVFWDGSCRAVDAAHEDYGSPDAAALPECGIRDTCRWWAQEGARACAVCPLVRTAATDVNAS